MTKPRGQNNPTSISPKKIKTLSRMEDISFLDSIDPDLYSHSTKTRQPQNDDNKAPQNLYEKIIDGAKKSSSLLPRSRIYRVPENLRRLNKRAYTPSVIAIGPLHRKDEHLQPMQKVKMFYTKKLLSRLTNEKFPTELLVLQECVEKMKECVDEAKRFYAAEVTVKENEMVEMMLVDGCFILELLYFCQQSKGDEQNTTNAGETSGCSKAVSNCCFPCISCPWHQQPTKGAEEGINDDEKCESPKTKREYPTFGDSVTFNMFQRDLLLLENQIPIFVLEKLFQLTVNQIPMDHMGKTKPSLTDYVWSYFGDFMRPQLTNSEGKNSCSKKSSSCGWPSGCIISVSCPTKEMEDSEGENRGSKKKTRHGSSCDCVLWVCCGSTKETEQRKKELGKINPCYHILHLLHDHYPAPKSKSKRFTELQVSASDLDLAGVKFVGNQNDLFDISFKQPKGMHFWFHRAEFQIPSIEIYDTTETLLRNLIALEQCSSRVSQHFTSYALLMDTLITSEEDVKVLKKAKVIRNYLGADVDVCRLFNKLCKEVSIGDFFFEDQCQEAFKYSEHWWPKWMAHWKRKYFASPWKFRAVCMAIIIFIIMVVGFIRSLCKNRV